MVEFPLPGLLGAVRHPQDLPGQSPSEAVGHGMMRLGLIGWSFRIVAFRPTRLILTSGRDDLFRRDPADIDQR
jgi:hypothetical protein